MRRALVLAAALLLAPSLARAACTASASGVAFGVYNPYSGAANDATGAVTVRCGGAPAAAPYVITLSAGGGGYGHRQMHSGAQTLPYQLYTDAGRSRVWGDGSGGTSVVQDVVQHQPRTASYSIFGRIPAGSTVAPGAYADVIVATVSY